MATIDILTVIDTQFLMEKVAEGKLSAGSLDSPTMLGSYDSSDKYIFMIGDGSYVVDGQGHSELNIQAQEADTVRWTITSPSDGMVYDCIQYGFESNDHNQVLTQPEVVNLPALAYHNHSGNSTRSFNTSYIQTAWICQVKDVTARTSVQYDWSFQIIDIPTGKTVAYFKWDPFIAVVPS